MSTFTSPIVYLSDDNLHKADTLPIVKSNNISSVSRVRTQDYPTQDGDNRVYIHFSVRMNNQDEFTVSLPVVPDKISGEALQFMKEERRNLLVNSRDNACVVFQRGGFEA